MIRSISKFPMKRFTQPWKLCRNIGTQPAGNAGCSPRPEVIITARVTPAPSPRWTFRGKGGATMPTCRPAVWGVDDRWGDTACSLNACLGAGVPALFNSEVEDFAASSASTAKASLPKPDPLSNRIRRCRRSASFLTGKAQFPPEIAGKPKGFESSCANGASLGFPNLDHLCSRCPVRFYLRA
jgi:hypothetical protein